MTSRRSFLTGLLAAGSLPTLTWADAGHPAWLSAARDPSGGYILCGLTLDGVIAFRVPLPDRGHAAAAHPVKPLAIAFARRPGRFALVLDCVSGQVRQTLDAPEGRHFYGHGAFLHGGDLLCTTENEIESGAGRIGLWDARRDFRRIGELPSGGTGPHEVVRLPRTDILAIANGGIRTHPDSGREKLNLDTMRPNLTLIDADGSRIDQVDLPRDLHRNSLRHLSTTRDGRVACAFQWQGDVFASPPLLGIYRQDTGLVLADWPEADLRRMNGYGGSVAFTADGGEVVITSPRGGTVQIFSGTGAFIRTLDQPDVCGASCVPARSIVSDGGGAVLALDGRTLVPLARHDLAWDNHLVALDPA